MDNRASFKRAASLALGLMAGGALSGCATSDMPGSAGITEICADINPAAFVYHNSNNGHYYVVQINNDKPIGFSASSLSVEIEAPNMEAIGYVTQFAAGYPRVTLGETRTDYNTSAPAAKDLVPEIQEVAEIALPQSQAGNYNPRCQPGFLNRMRRIPDFK